MLVRLPHQGLRRRRCRSRIPRRTRPTRGERRYSKTTRSRSKQGTSHSGGDDRKKHTLDVSALAAFSRGRAIMFASGAPAALLETVHWMNGPHAETVRASITAHDPSSKPHPPPRLPATGISPKGPPMTNGMGEWDDENDHTRSDVIDPAGDVGQPELFYPNVAAFVTDKLASTYLRQINVQGGTT